MADSGYAKYSGAGSGGGSGAGVSSLNSLTGAVTIAAGSNVTVTPSGNTLTIAASSSSGANQTLSNLTNPTAINQNLTFGASAAYTIVTPNATGSTASATLQVLSGNTVNGNTGAITYSSGDATGSGSAGMATFKGGAALGAGNGGSVTLKGGTSVSGNPGQIQFNSDNGIVLLPNTGSAAPFLQFFEGTQNFNVNLRASNSLATNIGLILPTAQGSAGAFLSNNGSGTLSFGGTLIAAQFPALTGDLTTTAGSLATTLATVNSNVGTFTNATVTVNAKGLITAASSGSAGFTNPMTTLGDIIYENATPAAARLAGNTTATKNFLTQTGNGTISAAPVWGVLASGDIPNNAANTSGTASNITGNLPTTQLSGTLQAAQFPALTGDVTTSAGALATTLATVNSNVGSFTNANITVNAKGLITAASNGTGGSSNPIVLAQIATPSSPSAGSNDLYFKADGNLYTLNSSGVETLVGGANAAYYSGYTSNAASWTSTSTSFADGTNAGGNALTQRKANGITVTAAASNLAGITFTPPSTSAVYLITAVAGVETTGGGAAVTGYSLTDGTAIIAQGDAFGSGSVGYRLPLSGVYSPNTTSPVTIKIQQAVNSSGTSYITSQATAAQSTIEWTVIQLNPGSGSNAINSQFFASSQVTTSSTLVTGSTFTSFSNATGILSFTPTVGGTYKVYSSVPIYANSAAGANGIIRIFNSSGSATLVAESQAINDGSAAAVAPIISLYTTSVYTLNAGTTYAFDIQGKQTLGTNGTQIDGTDSPFYMFAELITSGTAGAKSAIKTVTTSGTLLTTDNFVNVNSASATTQTLPISIQGQTFNIKNINTGTVTVTPTSGTIDGSASITLPVRYPSVELVFDSTNWWVY